MVLEPRAMMIAETYQNFQYEHYVRGSQFIRVNEVKQPTVHGRRDEGS